MQSTRTTLSKVERSILERLDSGDVVIFDSRFECYYWASNHSKVNTATFEAMEKQGLVAHVPSSGRYTYRHDITAAGQAAIG